MTLTVIITMAGGSRRFREAGYSRPKFELEARGRTLFEWSLESLRGFMAQGARWVFVAQEADAVAPFIREHCGRLGIEDWALVELPAMTDGQATTALLGARAVVDGSARLLVYNIDTYVEPWALPPSALRGAGWIPSFPGDGEGWSFARTEGPDLRVVEVREKQRISTHCTIGLYAFGSFDLYRDTYLRYYGDGRNLERGERYIAPMYNQLIADGRDVFVHEVPRSAVHPLGTPAEVEVFVRESLPTG